MSHHACRLKDFGPNRLTPAAKPGFLARLWAQLNNILIYILLAAAIVEGALQSWAEFGLVLGVIVINTAIGLIQEGKAEKVRGPWGQQFCVAGVLCDRSFAWQDLGGVCKIGCLQDKVTDGLCRGLCWVWLQYTQPAT
jgi:hypothetical protein